MKKVQEAIDMLECAVINCDNVKKLGVFFADAVKMQIQDAIRLLSEEDHGQAAQAQQP